MSRTDLSETGGRASLLTDRQRKFIAEYMVNYDGAGAARRAGYSEATAKAMANKLLKNPRIARIVGKIQKDDVEALKLDRYETLKQLFYCVTRTMDDFCDENGKIITNVNLLSERAKATIDGLDQEVTISPDGTTTIKTKLKLVPKAKTLEMAMKHHGLFEPEQVNVNVKQKLSWDDLYQPSDKPDMVEERIKSVENKAIDVEKEPDEQGTTL